MPVEDPDLQAGALVCPGTQRHGGSLPVLTWSIWVSGPTDAGSLVPQDPVLEVKDADVALTGIYQKRRRMTLTYPVLNRARRILWLVTEGKSPHAPGCSGRSFDSGGTSSQDQALVVADRDAAGK